MECSKHAENPTANLRPTDCPTTSPASVLITTLPYGGSAPVPVNAGPQSLSPFCLKGLPYTTFLFVRICPGIANVLLALVEFLKQFGAGPISTGLIVAGAFLFIGMFIDAIPAIIILGTVLWPVAEFAGLHPIHFAIIGVISLAFGLVTAMTLARTFPSFSAAISNAFKATLSPFMAASYIIFPVSSSIGRFFNTL